MGLTLLLNSKGNAFIKWIGSFMMVGGCGSFGVSAIVKFAPYFSYDPVLYAAALRIGIISFCIYFIILPFMFAMCSFILGGWTAGFWKWVWIPLLFILPARSFLQHIQFGEPTIYDMTGIRYWAGLYILLAIIAHIYGYFRESELIRKRDRLRTGMVLSIAVIWAYSTDYLSVDRWIISQNEFITEGRTLWQLNYIIVLWLVVFFIYYGIRYGFLGIKLRIEQQRMSHSIRTLTMGTSILNHNIKNEVQKLRYLAERTQASLVTADAERAMQSIEHMQRISEQMREMVTRMRDRSGVIVLREGVYRLADVIHQAVVPMEVSLQDREIQLSYEMVHDVYCRCDAIHVREAISNIVNNAVEAMKPGGGSIDLTLFLHGGDAVIDIRDNGVGIGKDNLPLILDPFFSTKKKMTNFGLGLSYCNSVMQKHGGQLTVISEWQVGTAVMLRFPTKRLVQSPERPAEVLSS
jgi:two-component system, sporulation sensor kinase B